MANSVEKSLIREALKSSKEEKVRKSSRNDGAFIRLINFRDIDRSNNISKIQQVKIYIPFFWYTF